MKQSLIITFSIFLGCSSCISKHDRNLPDGNHSQEEVNERYGNLEQEEEPNSEVEISMFPPEEKKSTPEADFPVQKKEKSVGDLYPLLVKSVFMVYSIHNEEQYSQGSGFFINKNIGITNFHVLKEGHENVISHNGNFYRIKNILDSSPTKELDYVIFETEFTSKNFLTISSLSPKIGEDVFAIGSPQGLENSLTKGAISGFRNYNRIQIDATIDHGSSGGPLFNLQGEVIGITTSGVGSGSELNFAVDISALPYQQYLN